MDSLSPYIADSLRKQKMEAAQLKALHDVVNDIYPPNELQPTVESRLSSLRYEKRRKRKQQRQDATKRARKAGATIGAPINREDIIRRDKSTCYLCGKTCEPHEIHLDHVMPLSKGGHHTAENLRVACSTCNLAKGDSVLPARYHPPST